MKNKTSLIIAAMVLALCALASAQSGWSIPQGGKDEKSPLKPTADLLKKGKAIFVSNCQKCHGAEGKGDGPDSDPKSPAADLTDDYRTSINPDGVLFYKISNGHAPEMPAFKAKLSKNEIWTVVEYAKSLRKPQ